MKLLRFLVLLVFSPTRALIERLMRDGGKPAAVTVIRWNIAWLCAELVVAFVLAGATTYRGQGVISPYVYGLLATIAFYRVNEVFCAFYGDAGNRLSGSPPRTPLTQVERIKQALRSYASLTINFAFIAFAFPSGFYSRPFAGFVDALYFSGTTISTLGYGDIVPTRGPSELLSMYEVFSGILLLVVALGVYLSGVGSEQKP